MDTLKLNHDTNIVPLVSIIIVVFKAAKELEPLLQSIIPFLSSEVELVVIDGGSPDGTLEILKSHSSQINYWVSEPDYGIYDAMMKGIRQAHGTFFLHLNAGDQLLKLPLDELRQAKDERIDIASFRVQLSSGKVFRPSAGRLLHYRNTLHHQGTFYRRGAFPGYDLNYRIFADFDVNQKMVFGGNKVKRYDLVVTFHSLCGISNTGDINELFRIVKKHRGFLAVFISYFLFRIFGLRDRIQIIGRTLFRRLS
jgi:glycosyltransferase involved in cell wall biosynthesis